MSSPVVIFVRKEPQKYKPRQTYSDVFKHKVELNLKSIRSKVKEKVGELDLPQIDKEITNYITLRS